MTFGFIEAEMASFPINRKRRLNPTFLPLS